MTANLHLALRRHRQSHGSGTTRVYQLHDFRSCAKTPIPRWQYCYCLQLGPFCTEFHSIGGMWYTLCFIMNRTESVQDNKPVQTTKSYMQTISLFNKCIPKAVNIAWSCPLFGLRFITENSAQCIFQWDVIINSLVLSKLQVNGCNNCIDQIGHFQANYLDHLWEPQPVHFHGFIKQTHWFENLLNAVMNQMTIK